MTSNQIAAREVRAKESANAENARTNRAKERETNRSNLVKEAETMRANKKNENLKAWEIGTKTGSSILNSILGLFSKNGSSKSNKNSPVWYDLNPDATKAVANVSFNVPLGSKVQSLANYFSAGSSNSVSGDLASPGILTLPFMTTLGDEDAANTAMFKIYAYVRHVNSGSRNYEATDYMMYLLAGDSIVTNFAFAEKIIRAYSTFSAKNKYMGAPLLEACGINVAERDLDRKEIASLIARYNILRSTFNSLSVPGVFYFITRHAWLAGSLFKDRSHDKAQIYNFIPRGYQSFRADETTPEQAGALQFISFKDELSEDFSLRALLDVLESQIAAMQTIEDFGIMVGDTLKAYGPSSLIQIPALDISSIYPLEPVYEPEVLSQIQAATLFGSLLKEEYSAVTGFYQEGIRIKQGYWSQSGKVQIMPLRFAIQGAGTLGGEARNSLLNKLKQADGFNYINKFKDNQDPRDTMVSTRLSAIYDTVYDSVADTICQELVVSGSEIITDAWITTGAYRGENQFVITKIPVCKEMIEVADVDSIFGSFHRYVLTSVYNSFYCLPLIRWITAFVSVNDTSILLRQDASIVSLSLNDFAIVEEDVLRNMHQVAIYSLFGVDSQASSKAMLKINPMD